MRVRSLVLLAFGFGVAVAGCSTPTASPTPKGIMIDDIDSLGIDDAAR